MTSWLNSCSATWAEWMLAMLWQSSLLIILVWIADIALRRFSWPSLRYALWLLVLVKLLLPPSFAMPTSLTASAASFIHRHIIQSIPIGYSPPESSRGVERYATIVPSNAQSVAANKYSAPISMQTKLMLAWFVGVALLSCWLFRHFQRFRKHRGRTDLPEWLLSIMQECAGKLLLKRLPAVAISPSVKCPAVLGLFKPLVLIPESRFDALTQLEARTIFIHEFSHIKRGDLIIHAAQFLLQIVYWPNILLWLIRRPMHDLRELCCDADVAAVLRDDTAFYRQTLLDMARRLIAEPVDSGMGLLGFFERPHTIVARLDYLEKPYGRQTMCKFLTAIAVIAMLFCVLPMSFSLAENLSSKTVTTTASIIASPAKPAISPTQQAKAAASQSQAIDQNSAVAVSGSNQGNFNGFGGGASQQPNGAAFSFPSAEAPDAKSADIPVEVDIHLFTASVDALQMALKQAGIAANSSATANASGSSSGEALISTADDGKVNSSFNAVNHPMMLQLPDSYAANLLNALSQNPGVKLSAFPAMLALQGHPAEVEFYNNEDGAYNKLQIQWTPRHVEKDSILAELRCSFSKPGDNGVKYVNNTAVGMHVTPDIQTLLTIYSAQDSMTYAIVKLTPKL